jgi:exosome complex exonuclease DIS3/RRP44
MIAKAVAGELRRENEQLKKEVDGLRLEVRQKTGLIEDLQEKMDELEQYSRRTCLRISNIPEKAGEDTDRLVLAVAEAAGVSLPLEAIERSHRVGKASSFADVASGASRGGDRRTAPRQVIVKFVSYRHRDQLMRARKNLRTADIKARLPNLDWSTVPLPRSRHDSTPVSTRPKVFINEDLTRERAKIAAKARELKREKSISDTWTRDGAVFVKRTDSNIFKVTTFRQLLNIYRVTSQV